MTCHTFDEILFQGLGYNYRLLSANKVSSKLTDISKAKEKAELAELEAKFAEAKFSQLLLNGDLSPSLALNPVKLIPEITPVTSSLVVAAVSTQACTFPEANE